MAAPPSLKHSFRALRHRNFRLFLGGQIVSLAGTWMQRIYVRPGIVPEAPV